MQQTKIVTIKKKKKVFIYVKREYNKEKEIKFR